MSLENVTLDFGHLSFDSNNNNTSNMSTTHYNSVQPSIKVTKDNKRSNRNRKCVPSDDEEEEEDDDLSSDDEYSGLPHGKPALRSNHVITSTISTPTKSSRKTQPLPSDDEDEDDEEDDEEDEEDDNKLLGSKVVPPIGRTSPDPGSRSGPIYKQQSYSPQEDFYQHQGGNTSRDYLNYSNNDDNDALINPNNMRGSSPTPPILTLPEGSHLQQLQQMQQYHQSQMAQFQYHQMQQQQPSPSKSSSSHLLRPGTPSNGQRVSMSGMDLLKQLEQEKADAKRLKPKLDTSHVKIEGLLGRLPEPGSHNISFQQLQQQQHQQHLQQQQQQHQFLLQQQQFQQQQFQYQQQFQHQQQQHVLKPKKSNQRITVAPGYLEPYYQQCPPRSPSPSGTRHRQQGSRSSNNLY
ncbi:hypothetical protein K501DRAFT_286771 [Backusella circina FSU 941]|nr:hypothetical protein K501DRAFT_286771 [Backusella circina FSU 941]